jgi:hypothetical protein
MLQQQIDLAGSQLAEQQTKTQYAPQTAEANYAKLLADTEAAQTANRFAGPQAEADIRYKNAIGSSAQSNADTAAMQAQITQAQLPGTLLKIEKENEILKLRYDVMAKELAKMAGGNPGLSSEPGLSTPSVGQLMTDEQGQQIVPAKGNLPAHVFGSMPEDFLSPNAGQVEAPSLVEKDIIEPMRSEAQQAEVVGEASQKGRQKAINKAQYDAKAVSDASLASNENTMLDQMNQKFKDIPYWNKGLVTKFMEDTLGPLAQESKVYTTLKNGLIFENLGNLKGAASDLDVQKIEAMFPGLTFTDESTEEAIVLRQLINDRKMEKLSFIARLEEGNPNVNEKQIESAWNGFQNHNSIFDSERWKALQDPEGIL